MYDNVLYISTQTEQKKNRHGIARGPRPRIYINGNLFSIDTTEFTEHTAVISPSAVYIP